MKSLLKKSLIIVLCLVMVLSLSACTKKNKDDIVDPILFDKNHQNIHSDSFVITNDNSNYELRWDAENLRILLVNKTTGRISSVTPSNLLEDRTDENGFPVNNHPKLEGNIIIEYIDKLNNSVTKTANGYVQSLKSKTYSIEKTEDGKGFKLTYYFDKASISIPVIYSLLDDGIKMTVVPQEITETEDNLITKVSVAPFFCSVPNIDDDAYLFYPSGSGAIIEANNSSEISTYLSNDVFGKDALEGEFMGVSWSATETVRLPVFGSKNDNEGVLAVISEGADTAIVEADIGNATIGYSSIYATFKIRGSNIANKVANGLQYSEQFAYTPMSVNFYPLDDEEASYVGMANRYRKFLIEEKGMTDKTEEASASISLVGGTNLNTSFLGMPKTEVYATTTVEDAEDILTDINEQLNLPVIADLYGFGSSGIDAGKPAGNLQIAKNIGNESQIKDLSNKCKELGIDLYFDYDLLHFTTDGLGLTITKGGSAKGPGHVYTKWQSFELGSSSASISSYLIGRKELPVIAKKAVKHTVSMNVQGISFRKITSRAYSDYSYNRSIAKANMGNDVSAILKDAKDSGLKVLGNQANEYAAIYSDAIIDVPVTSSKYTVFDYDIPFYQLVFKGYVPMYGVAINTTTDQNHAILNCVEGGSNLKYTVMKNYDNSLLTSKIQIFNSLLYDDNKEKIVSIVNANADYFTAIADAHIINHVCINDDVRKIVYDNGVIVYVNYGYKDYESDMGKVDAGSYIYGKEVTE